MKKFNISTLSGLGLLLSIAGIVFGLPQIKQIQTLYSHASRQPANLIVDAQGDLGELKPTWKNLAQGGEGSWFSVKTLSDHLKPLTPQYIRIDHLYDFYVTVSRSSNGLSYDFSKLDQLLQEMKDMGVIPFISLSYTPDILNSDITGVPNNWAEYQQVIQKTIEHVSGKQGLNIENVYYEVWNEPDLFGQWKTYGDKNYLNLYRAAAKGAAQAQHVHPFKLGGPATTKLYDNWIDKLLEMVVVENLQFDFYSWHHYNLNPMAYAEDMDRLDSKIRMYPTVALKLEYIISEWGIDSDLNPAYDNDISAAHLVSSVTSFPPNLSRAFVFEIQDGKSPEGNELWGRWGLITHPDFGSKPKPRARALYLLNQLGPTRLGVSGHGTNVRAIATKKGTETQVLIANYDAENRYAEQVPVTVKRLQPGIYTLAKTFLGRRRSTQQIHIEQNSYTTTVPMAANSVVLLEFIPEN